MVKLPAPPPETGAVAIDRDLMQLAPKFREQVMALLDQMDALGHDPMVFEGFRSDARALYLYGFGRDYDDDRGIVTNAPTAAKTWHRYGLAVDIISRVAAWNAPDRFWKDLRATAEELGLVSGAAWLTPDRPHVQWAIPTMHVTPSDHAWELLQSAGVQAVWSELKAI